MSHVPKPSFPASCANGLDTRMSLVLNVSDHMAGEGVALGPINQERISSIVRNKLSFHALDIMSMQSSPLPPFLQMGRCSAYMIGDRHGYYSANRQIIDVYFFWIQVKYDAMCALRHFLMSPRHIVSKLRYSSVWK